MKRLESPQIHRILAEIARSVGKSDVSREASELATPFSNAVKPRFACWIFSRCRSLCHHVARPHDAVKNRDQLTELTDRESPLFQGKVGISDETQWDRQRQPNTRQASSSDTFPSTTSWRAPSANVVAPAERADSFIALNDSRRRIISFNSGVMTSNSNAAAWPKYPL